MIITFIKLRWFKLAKNFKNLMKSSWKFVFSWWNSSLEYYFMANFYPDSLETPSKITYFWPLILL